MSLPADWETGHFCKAQERHCDPQGMKMSINAVVVSMGRLLEASMASISTSSMIRERRCLN